MSAALLSAINKLASVLNTAKADAGLVKTAARKKNPAKRRVKARTVKKRAVRKTNPKQRVYKKPNPKPYFVTVGKFSTLAAAEKYARDFVDKSGWAVSIEYDNSPYVGLNEHTRAQEKKTK